MIRDRKTIIPSLVKLAEEHGWKTGAYVELNRFNDRIKSPSGTVYDLTDLLRTGKTQEEIIKLIEGP